MGNRHEKERTAIQIVTYFIAKPFHGGCTLGRPHAQLSTIFCSEANQHQWLIFSSKRINFCICSALGKRRCMHTKWKKCDMRLRFLRCFTEYHTKAKNLAR
jgi:hypothetical protein